jgi:hypothetical protein
MSYNKNQDCGIEITVYKKDGTTEKKQVWGYTASEAEQMAQDLVSLKIEGVELLERAVKVLYHY